MSDLQTGLVVAGIAVVVLVVLYNWWQERQFRRRAERAFARDHDDVLMRDSATVRGEAGERMEPTLVPSDEAVADNLPIPVVAASVIDPLIDYVLDVELPDPCDGAALLGDLRELSSGWGKPVKAAIFDGSSGTWRDVERDDAPHSARLRFALQLSNRSGCVSTQQLVAFRDVVADWSRRNKGSMQGQEISEAHAMAVQLDQFCSDMDVTIGVNVVAADGDFTGERIHALAGECGLVLGTEGLYYLPARGGGTRFTLGNHEQVPFARQGAGKLLTRGVTFLLDVPRADNPLWVFETMLEIARRFADGLGGRMVDDNRVALSEEAIQRIRRQLGGIAARMEAGQILAGGERALRLFS